jgi:hypothetical protein
MVRSAAWDEANDMAETLVSAALMERTSNVLFGFISSPSGIVEKVIHREEPTTCCTAPTTVPIEALSVRSTAKA